MNRRWFVLTLWALLGGAPASAWAHLTLPLFEVTSPAGVRHLLVGSMHAGYYGDFSLDPEQMSLIDAYKRIYFEMPPGDPEAAQKPVAAIRELTLPPGEQQQISQDMRAMIGRIEARKEIPPVLREVLLSKHPLLIHYVLLAVCLNGNDPGRSVDLLIRGALTKDHEVLQLESLADSLAEVPLVSIEQWRSHLEGLGRFFADPNCGARLSAQLHRVSDLYEKGDSDALPETMLRFYRSELSSVVIQEAFELDGERDARTVATIISQSEPAVFVVGALHLVRQSGLVSRLRRAGWSVERK